MKSAELDPVAIRQSLTASRNASQPWEQAWTDAIDRYEIHPDEKGLYRFMERNFRAAYYDTPSSLGRCSVPETDTSSAIPALGATVTGRNLERDEEIIATVNDGEPYQAVAVRCRSGDGCDRLATRGRFGKHFCEHHRAELMRLADKLQLDRDWANPHNGGNNAIFQRFAPLEVITT